MAYPKKAVEQIRIRTGVLKRCVKEKASYEKQLEQDKERLEKMRGENRDEHEINKQQEVINETLMLLPDCQKRIVEAYDHLQKLVQEAGDELVENEIYVTAKTLLEEMKIT